MTERFEILEGIATGGMAEVYRAQVVEADGRSQQVCIKKILPHLVTDTQALDMFVGEAQLAATLTCPQIVQVFDLCVSHDNEYFIVMEYVDGLDLARLVHQAKRRQIRIPTDAVVRIVVELCRGLQYAHTRTDTQGEELRIVHRDISPQNILLSESGDVKITDFGIAKSSLMMATTAMGVLKGKYGYMSPEQANGLPLDHRSDLFNVGILLYELLTMERCFAGASDFSTLRLMRHAEVVPPRQMNQDIHPHLESIVLKALAKDPKDRFQSAQELTNALLLCPGVELGSKESLGELVAQLAVASSEPTQEGTGVLSLSSIVHRGTPDLLTSTTEANELVARTIDGAGSRGPSPHITRSAPTPKRTVPAWVWAAAGVLVGGGLSMLTLLEPADPERAVAQARTQTQARGEPTVVLLFESEPSGARVFLDGIELAGPTPVVVERPPDSAEHQVRFELEGADPQILTARWGDEPLTRIRGTLERRTASLSGRAGLAVRSFPEGDVLVDGEPQGRSDGSWLQVPSGERRIQVRAPHGRSGRPVTLNLQEGSQTELLFQFDDG